MKIAIPLLGIIKSSCIITHEVLKFANKKISILELIFWLRFYSILRASVSNAFSLRSVQNIILRFRLHEL